MSKYYTCYCFNYTAVDFEKEDAAAVKAKVSQFLHNYPRRKLLMFPEGVTGNSRNQSVMKYNKPVFDLGEAVQPVALKIINPWPGESTRHSFTIVLVSTRIASSRRMALVSYQKERSLLMVL